MCCDGSNRVQESGLVKMVQHTSAGQEGVLVLFVETGCPEEVVVVVYYRLHTAVMTRMQKRGDYFWTGKQESF